MGLILFLAAINLVASVYNAAFPAMMLSRNGGSEWVMGLVNTVVGLSTLAGLLVDGVFEPFMAARSADSLLVYLFGSQKGSGAAFLFFVLAFTGIGVCLFFRRNPDIWALEKEE